MTTPDTLQAALDALTPSGTAFMRLVGERYFDFFDGGIVAGEGNWGPHMAQQAQKPMGKSARSMGGIMSRLLDLELWTSDIQESDQGLERWWQLTELGAAVANALASSAEPTPAEAFVAAVKAAPQPGKANVHASCSHPRTKAARAACRRAKAKGGEAPAAAPAPELSEAAQELEAAIQLEHDTDDDPAAIALLLDTADPDVLAELDGDAYADAMLAEVTPCTCDSVTGPHTATRACY